METPSQGPSDSGRADLGNFLSGMETQIDYDASAAPGALETSLVEWKLGHSTAQSSRERSLETSLVEWKQMMSLTSEDCAHTLETSLVEWKRASMARRMRPRSGLGNFLSGMETDSCGAGGGGYLLPWKLP